MHGHVESWAYPDKIVPEGTVLELLDLAHRPFNPPVLARTDKIGNVSFLLPDDVDRYVARVEINGESSYLAMPRYRRGVVDRIVFRVAGAKEVAYFASQAGVKLAPGMGVLMGSVYWGDPKDYGRSTSVGCVSVTMDGGVAPLFSLPTSRSLVGLDARMKVQHPGAPFFYFFNVPPGEHVITARLGDTVVEERTVLHAGCLTRIGLNFPLDRYPEDPTPPDCLANWPPTE